MGIRLIESLLDRSNSRSLGATTVGQAVRTMGKEHLWGERGDNRVDTIVVHYISAKNTEPRRRFDVDAVLRIFCSLAVSSHYLIDRRGRIIRLVPEERKAWHAGGSLMPPPDCREGVNDFSLGIELIATHDSGFTGSQYRSLILLCLEIERRFGYPMKYVGHAAIAGSEAVQRGLRQDIKYDPGPLFDWPRLYRGLGRGEIISASTMP